MSIIMYKQRHFNKREANTPRMVYGYVRYIAERPGTMANDGMGHGLFGSLGNKEGIQCFADPKELARRGYDDTKNGHTYFKSIISMADADAADAGIWRTAADGDGRLSIDRTDRAGWERYVARHMGLIAGQNGIAPENLAWTCAIHLKDGHSHAHLVFWDKSEKSTYHAPPVDETAVRRINGLRRELIKQTFPHRIRAHMEARNLAYHSLRDFTAAVVDDFTAAQSLSAAQASGEWGRTAPDGTAKPESILAGIHGRIAASYGKGHFRGPPVYDRLADADKAMLTAAARELIDAVPELKARHESYIQAKLAEQGMFSGGRETDWRDGLGGPAEEHAVNRDRAAAGREDSVRSNAIETVARRIYNSVKHDINSDAVMKWAAFDLIRQCLRMFAGHGAADRGGRDRRGRRGGLSKMARRELYLENRDKGYEH